MATAPLTVVNDVTCTACGCLCDDLVVTSDDGAITNIDNACEHGDEWFRTASQRPTVAAMVGGRPAQLESALAAAAELLVAARMPLVFGLATLDVAGQRAAVALADELGAALDSGTPADDSAALFPGVGAMTCTWGEVVQRADLVIYWRCSFDAHHWRHRDRVMDKLRQRGGCEIVSVSNEGSGWPVDDFTTIWTLRALVRNRRVAGKLTHEVTQLVARMKAARYSVIVHDGDPQLAVALHALATDVNATTRCRVMDLGRPANAAGELQVTTWQTGYARGVGLHRGYPVSHGREFTAERLLVRGETDAAFSVGSSAAQLPETARQRLTYIPHVVLSPGTAQFDESPQIVLFTAMPGFDAAGVTFRSDDITLPLRAVVPPSLPPADVVIQGLITAVRAQHG